MDVQRLGAASMPGRWRGRGGFNVRQNCRITVLIFFPGKNPDLGADLAGCRLRCRAGGAAGGFSSRVVRRSATGVDAVVEELSALLPKEQLYQLYEQATREPYSFLFVYYLKPKNEMFYKRFEERFALEREADGSGAQLPGPEAVRQFHTH